MTETRETPAERLAPLGAPGAWRAIAAIADGAAESVTDLRVRGGPNEIADELRETHLPALEAAGYIEWDREAGTIAPGPNFEEAADHVAGLPFPGGDALDEPADD